MNLRSVMAITKKDFLEVRHNKSVWMPMLILPLVFVILLPLAMILVPPALGPEAQSLTSDPDLAIFFERMPAGMKEAIAGFDTNQTMVYVMLGYMFAPFFLILPLMFATVIAAESFAGERERKTLEALLYTPTSDAELFLGKVLTALIPAVGISWFSFGVYTVVLNTVGFGLFDRIWFPLPSWYVLIFWITPALAVIGVAATVLISSREQTFMGAYQSSAALVLLPIGLMVGQMTGVLYLTVGASLLIGLVFWLISAGLTRLAVHSFRRTQLLVGTINNRK